MNGMAFTNPTFLYMLPLAALPVLFHLFFRRRAKTVSFPTLIFFQRIDPQLHQRRRLREILTLILRCLAILLFLLAFGGLSMKGSGKGSRTACVILLDNSASMSGMSTTGEKDVSRLDLAARAAGAIIGDLSADDVAGVVLTVDDKDASLPAGLEADKSGLLHGLKKIRPTEASGLPIAALTRAQKLLKESSFPSREIHIFSDLQKSDWGKNVPNTDAVDSSIKIFIHQIEAQNLKSANVNISEFSPAGERILTGRKSLFTARLHNTSKQSANFRLLLEDDAGIGSSSQYTLEAGEQKTVSLLHTPKNSGLHWLCCRIEGDSFLADNRAYCTFEALDKVTALLIGEKRDFGLLPFAFSPTGTGELSGIKVEYFPAGEATSKIKSLSHNANNAERPVLVSVAWNVFDSILCNNGKPLAELERFVREGGTLLVFCNQNNQQRNVISPFAGVEVSPQTLAYASGAPLPKAVIFEKDNALWEQVRNSQGEISLTGFEMKKYHALTPAGSTALCGLQSGEGIITFKHVGSGAIYCFGFGFSAKDSTLPLKPSFMALMQAMALNNKTPSPESDRNFKTQNYIAGERISLHGENISLNTMAGDIPEWRGSSSILEQFPRSGVCALQEENDPRGIAAVSSAPSEGVAEFYSSAPIPAIPSSNVEPIKFTDIESLRKEVSLNRNGLELYAPLLLLALLCLLLESWLVNQARRKNKTASASDNVTAAAAIAWYPHLGGLSTALLILALCWLIYIFYRRLSTRTIPTTARNLLVPKALVLTLLVVALLDPAVKFRRHVGRPARVLIVKDISGSMQISESSEGVKRIDRAENILNKISSAIPSVTGIDTDSFSETYFSGNKKPEKALQVNGSEEKYTNLGGALSAIKEKTDSGLYQHVILLTDGGDERLVRPRLPTCPLSVVAVGSAPESWDDLAIGEVQFPETVESETGFEISAEVMAHAASTEFRNKSQKAELRLEVSKDKKWELLEKKNLALEHGRCLTSFKVDKVGSGVFRLVLQNIPGEISYLNNTRELSVNVKDKSLHVLYYAPRLGVSYKYLRQELVRDPGISFTALLRLDQAHYLLQGDRLDGDEDVARGFPTSAEKLSLYDCIIISSCRVESLGEKRLQAISEYTSKGGAVVFLGGVDSFGLGGWADSKAAILLPWQINAKEAPFVTGAYAVSIPAETTGHTVVSGVGEIIAKAGKANLQSLNFPGPLRPGATALLTAVSPQGEVAVAALQQVAKGFTMGIATDTFWRWAASGGQLSKAYGTFWRQAVRHICGNDDAGKYLSVSLDRSRYLPGSVGAVTVRVLRDKQARIDMKLFDGQKSVSLLPEGIPGAHNTFTSAIELTHTGEYTLDITAHDEGGEIEHREKKISVSPGMKEGSRLEVDQTFLQELTRQSRGLYSDEKGIDEFCSRIGEKISAGQTELTEVRLFSGSTIPALILLGLLLTEWFMRRRKNLL